jgi:CheY-like chemotaxis protein
MSEEVRQRCLEPWFTTKGEKGTGLGLATVYGTIQRHDGTINIESKVGQGSKFIIHLPAQTGPVMLEGVAAPPSSWRPLRVLLVDDNPEVLRVIAGYLSGDGHTVETAADGHEGLQRFMAGKFDLVVSDLAMPEMSGNQLAAIIQQIAPHTPVIRLSGFNGAPGEPGEASESAGPIMTKPVTLEQLRQAIAQVT